MAEKPGGKNKELGNINEDELSSIAQIESSNKKKGGMKKLLFIVLPLLIILGGGGFAAYHFLLAKKAKTQKSKVKTSSTITQQNIGPMLNLKPFLTNLANKNSSSFVKVSVSLEFKPGTNLAAMKSFVPIIRNNILIILSSKTSGEINSPEGIRSLRHQIARGLNRILGHGKVIGVYFNEYMVQS